MSDPYSVLGVRPGASSEELHDAYRRLVKKHHPDRNGGSAESTRKFQEIQQAYEAVRSGRVNPPPTPPRRDHDSVETRMADIERELREVRERARAAASNARTAARDAVRDATAGTRRPTDEELGYYSTDDSFGAIFADLKDEVADKLSHAREHPAVQRVADLVDGLDDLTKRFGDGSGKPR